MAAAIQCDNCAKTMKQDETMMDPENPWYQVFIDGEGFDLCGPKCGMDWMKNEYENGAGSATIPTPQAQPAKRKAEATP